MSVVCGGHFWQLASSSSYRNYRWVILVAFCPKHGLRSDLRVPNLKNFPGRACLQPHLACSYHNSLHSLKELAPVLQPGFTVRSKALLWPERLALRVRLHHFSAPLLLNIFLRYCQVTIIFPLGVQLASTEKGGKFLTANFCSLLTAF